MPLPAYLKFPDAATAPAGRNDLNDVASSPSDTQATVAAENAPMRVVYGRARIGAQIANVFVHQGKLIVQAVWCEGEIQAVESVTMGDEALPAGVSATHYTGSAGQTANSDLVAAFASQGISYTDALPGVAYSVFSVPATDSSGFPSFEAIIQGRKVYNPSTASTAYSTNPALALADFIGSTLYGLGRDVDWASVEDAADACDSTVGGQPRRTIGLCIDSVAETRQHIEALRTYAGCWVVERGGALVLMPDRPRPTDHTIGASDLLASSLRLKKRGLRDVPTVVDVRWTDTTVTPWAERRAIAKAAGVDAGTTPRRESQVSLPGIQSYAQAYREAVERLNHFSLEDLEAEWGQFDGGAAIEPGDVVSLSHPIGLTAKLMRVTGVVIASPGRYRVKAREYDPAAYSDAVQAEPSYADTSLPNPASPPALSGLTATEEVYQLENGTWSSRIKLTWTAADYPYLAHYRVEVYRLGELISAGNAREAVFRTPAVQEGVGYVCKVAAVTTIGTVGTWAQANLTPAGKYLIPSDVPSLAAFEAGGRVYVSWGAAVDIDIWRYEVRYGPTAGAWESATLIDRVDALRLTSDQIPVGTWMLYVKALDSVGQYSANAASATVTVTSDASAFLVDSYDSDSPTLTNMAGFTLHPTDAHTHYVTEDGATVASKFGSALSTYTSVLATYHSSVTSTWLGEAEDFGMLLGGQWTGAADVAALSGSLISYLGFSTDGSSWTYLSGLSQKQNSRFARFKHEATTTSTLKVTVPTQNIRLDAIPREEVGTGTSSASGPVTITLENDYVAVKKLTITPEGTTARSATYDNVVVGNPTTFDVYVFNDSGVKIASTFRYEFQGV